MAGVRIVTDSSCDLTADETDALGIEVVPLSIRFGSEEFTDREELSVTEFYKKMATSDDLPETAAPSPGTFEERFRQLRSEGADAVVCITISGDLSATGEAAQQALRIIGDDFDVRVIDSKSITAGLGSMVLRAARAAEAGQSADEIEAMLADVIPRTHVFGCLNTLENLKKGGRIGGAKAMLGSLLDIKPIIDISTGVVEESGKKRTRTKSLAYMRQLLAEASPVEDLAILHADAKDFDEFVASVNDEFPDVEFRTGMIGAVIGAHGGPGTLGLCWVDPA
jgi:DegV family protein with EDD domain